MRVSSWVAEDRPGALESHLTLELRAVELASKGLSFPTGQMKMPVTPLLPAGFRPVDLDVGN